MERNKTALITGASKGLGFALAEKLAQHNWNLIITARDAQVLLTSQKRLSKLTQVVAISGDVRDEIHLLQIPEELARTDWKLDLVVNNASTLGMTPLKRLFDHPIDALHVLFHTNLIAPISLLQKVKSFLTPQATIINISSDAAVEPYETWGGYGGSKAGLDHMTSILGKENPDLNVYSFDPGDMRTDMHQAAFPNEDISDRPHPDEHAVPAIWQLIHSELPSGRYSWQAIKSPVL